GVEKVVPVEAGGVGLDDVAVAPLGVVVEVLHPRGVDFDGGELATAACQPSRQGALRGSDLDDPVRGGRVEGFADAADDVFVDQEILAELPAGFAIVVRTGRFAEGLPGGFAWVGGFGHGRKLAKSGHWTVDIGQWTLDSGQWAGSAAVEGVRWSS